MQETSQINYVVLQLAAVAPDIAVIAKLPGLRLVERQGCYLFHSYDREGNSSHQHAMLVTGPEELVSAFDVRSDGKPWTSNGVHGIAIRFEGVGTTGVAAIEDVSRRILSSIQQLKLHMYPCAPGVDWALDACWRH
jgi:hypothetical protein